MLLTKLLSSVFFFLLLFIIPFTLKAQTTTLTGKVTDESGSPVENVSVVIKGTNIGTTTAADGTYKLTATKPSGNVLVFSSVNFTDKEITQSGNTVNIQLEKSTQSLDAVVVVGYGTQKRKDVTGSIVSIDKQRLENMPNSNFVQALEGSLPGVNINTNGGGAEGNNVSIIIRGQKSINGSRSPLIILDGIPYQGSISDINPSDIASIDVLKDASASAIYGARSANGVILLTTKKGTGSKPVISYDGFTGTMEYANLPPVLIGDDFYNFKSAVTKTIVTANADATVSGGKNASTNYSSQKQLAVILDASQQGNNKVSYIHFDLPPKYNNVQSVMLAVNGKADKGNEPYRLHVYGIPSKKWDEKKLNWNNAPLLDSKEALIKDVGQKAFVAGEIAFNTKQQDHMLDVTDLVKKNSGKGITFVLVRETRQLGDDDDKGREVWISSSKGRYQPTLEFWFSK